MQITPADRGNEDVVRVELTLRRRLEPISGELRVAGGRVSEFSGMLELMSLLDAARASPEVQPGSNAR